MIDEVLQEVQKQFDSGKIGMPYLYQNAIKLINQKFPDQKEEKKDQILEEIYDRLEV